MLVLIVSDALLHEQLATTLLWRKGISRQFAKDAKAALATAKASRPDVIVVDRDVEDAARLVQALRVDEVTRRASIVIVARTELKLMEIELLESGANAVLRFPVDAEWDQRLARLMSVPARQDVRLPVYVGIELTAGNVKSILATTLNLSTTGMLIETDFDLCVGDDVEFCIRLPGSCSAVVGTGRVVRISERRHKGLEFRRLEGKSAELLRSFLEEREEP